MAEQSCVGPRLIDLWVVGWVGCEVGWVGCEVGCVVDGCTSMTW